MSLKYEPVSVEIESCNDLVQLSIPEIESGLGAAEAQSVHTAQSVPSKFFRLYSI